jgi:hypothetical protein
LSDLRSEAARTLPVCVQEEFEACLKCGWLAEGFLRVRCEMCHAEKLVAFGCRKRGVCPYRGARRMSESAPLRLQELEVDANDAGRAGGFSLHVGLEIAPHQRDGRDRLCH